MNKKSYPPPASLQDGLTQWNKMTPADRSIKLTEN